MRCRILDGFLPVLVLAVLAGTSLADDSPIASGGYEIRFGGERIGEEQFRLFQKRGYRLELTRTVYWPEPIRYEYRYELDSSRAPKKLQLKTTRGGNFTELKLQKKGKNWRTEVKGRGRKKQKHELGRRDGTIVDFDSLVFTTLALRELRLQPGQHKTVDAIVLAMPDIAGARVQQTYRRVDDEELTTEVRGTVMAAVYELDVQGKTHRLWVDPSGVVLKGVFDRIGGEQEMVLTRVDHEPDAF